MKVTQIVEANTSEAEPRAHAAEATRDGVGEPPPLATAERSARLVDQAAAGAAYELVHRIELLLDHWGNEPPPALRQGGLSVRDLKATAALLPYTLAGVVLPPYMPHSEPLVKYVSLLTALWL